MLSLAQSSFLGTSLNPSTQVPSAPPCPKSCLGGLPCQEACPLPSAPHPGRASLSKAKCPGTEPADPRPVMSCCRDPANILMHPPKQFTSIHHITCTHLYSHLKPTLMYNLFHVLTPPIPPNTQTHTSLSISFPTSIPTPPRQAPTLLESSPHTPSRISLQVIPLPVQTKPGHVTKQSGPAGQVLHAAHR